MLPDGPERLAVMDEAKKLMVAYMPYKVHVHRIFTDLAHPWVVGYHRNIFVREFYKYVDIDTDELRRRGRRRRCTGRGTMKRRDTLALGAGPARLGAARPGAATARVGAPGRARCCASSSRWPKRASTRCA
jgi:hypothetical protein